MPRTRQPQPRARTHEDFAAITITVVVERARVDEAMRAAADTAANISGAVSTQVSPVAHYLDRAHWLDNIRLASVGSSTASTCSRVQQMFADKLREILELEPLRARMNARTAESVIADVLQQADERGKVGVVAQYLVGAKLQLRFPGQDIQREAYNKGDRKKRGDPHARLADFEVAEAVIEVALGTPDEKHLDQVMDILETSSSEVWLLVRAARLGAWQSELAALNAPMRQRVVVVGVESFVGQNVTELGGFSSKGKHDQLLALFKLYNEQWIERLGPASLRIDAGPPVQASEGGVPRSRV